MTLYLLRHAIAVERGSPGYAHDRLRPLTAKGERRMRRIAEGMLALGLSFELILSSPFLRAKQTAEIVADIFKAQGRLHIAATLAPAGDPQHFIEELLARYRAPQHILIVGHEPNLSRLISMLVSGSSDFSVVMKKGGLCKLSVETLRYGRCANLEWLMPPRQLRRLA